MATSALLDADFGSESEDDNFNPAPADVSDNDAVGESDTENTAKHLGGQGEQPRRAPQGDSHGVAVGEELDVRRGGEQSLPRSREENVSRNTNGNGQDVVEDYGENDTGIGAGEGDDDEDDEDEEDEDEEDDEEAVSGRPRKRARRDRRNQFLDMEAEVDEEDDGDEDDDEEQPDGFIADTHPDDLADLPVGAETDDRRHRELDRRRELEQSLDAEKQAQALKERYGRNRVAPSDSVVVPKRLLLPSVDDPSVWGVRCKPGKEKEVVFGIMKRIEERAATRNPVPIISAFERGGTMIGYVYIEARKQVDIFTALDGLANVYPRVKCVLVPIKEMPDLLRVTKSEQLQPGGYVRMKRGKYAGDLAQIDDVETNGLEVSLRIVPRLDYGASEDINAPMIDNGVKGDVQKRKRQGALGLNNPASRPPQRLFSEVEAKKKHLKYLQPVSNLDKKHWTYLGDTYINGFLIKDVKIQHLITENVNPTLEEVTKFTAGAEDGTENLDLAALAASLKNNTAIDNYLPGDMVEVYEGEQQGVRGKAVSVRGDIVTLNVTDGDLRGQMIEVPVKGLRKRFREGDHVKVIGGSRFRDEVGMVVRIKDDRVTLLSDLSMQEITVFSKDLREATDSGVAGGLGKYDVHDLVQLDPATVACVTKVDRESLRVLDQNGSIRSIMPSQISNKIEKRRHAVATDRNGSEIRTDDTVREIGGEQKQGVILHIYRSFLFLHNREQTENSGLSVVRATNVATVAAKGGRLTGSGATGPDLSRMNPALQRNGGANGNGAMPPPKSYGRDRALGQTVTIRRGPYKGLLGIVKDTTDLEARVELHTKGKTITVSKDTLGFKDPLTGQAIDYQRFAGSRGRGAPGRGGFGGATPSRVPQDWQGSRTPMGAGNGSRTPAWGASSRTPAWAPNGGRTPAWKSDSLAGSRTPAYGADGARTVNPYVDGSRTAYGGAGGRTPAFNPSSRTPFGESGYSDAFNAGSKTPHADFGGSRTPAYQAPSTNNDTWANNRTYDAPTPGLSGGISSASLASTPAAPPTPRFTAWGGEAAPETPGGGLAQTAPTPSSETPAAWGGDDGPRYEEGTPSP